MLSITMLFSCQDNKKEPIENNAQVFFGGDIITMVGDTPEYAEAVVENNGKIVFVGSSDEAMTIAGKGHKMIDLKGKTLLPGFIDAHGHVYNSGLMSLAAGLLPEPDGDCGSIDVLIEKMKQWQIDNPEIIKKYNVILGMGYDDSQLSEKRHPTADDLDKISTEIPVLVVHQSSHLGSMNHKALELVGYVDGVKDPEGGVIRREPGTNKPNGVLEEMAFFAPLIKLMGQLDYNSNLEVAKAGMASYIKYGYTTAQEGRATKDVCEIWKTLGESGDLKIDVAGYPDLQIEMDYMMQEGVQKEYKNHYRTAGVKLSLDGSPQGKTAWISEPYTSDKNNSGYPAIPDNEEVQRLIDTAFVKNWQVLAHCNGDAASDQYLNALKTATANYSNKGRRDVMVHSQTVRLDQLDDMKTLGIIPSFFGMHTFYWGDVHVENLGKERAYKISPAATAKKKGMLFTQHHDSPIVFPNSIMILHAVVNRTSRTGQIIGADERISPYDAIKSITSAAAYQHYEEDLKGDLTEGKLADFVILDKNPLKVSPDKIKEIQVLQTIKEGQVVYQK
ncbi:hydrolase [Bizionia arctica]|uniref:Hydrolase n=2 Tax=Bizionia arctica TaxID=1495645 RepID=A0A917GHM6_9FLAO|nr:hydrolase [Bizionia arctica]